MSNGKNNYVINRINHSTSLYLKKKKLVAALVKIKRYIIEIIMLYEVYLLKNTKLKQENYFTSVIETFEIKIN